MPKIPHKASDEHEFNSLEQRQFEHFVAALHEAQPGILYAKLYAPDDQKQFGIDHVAFARDASGQTLLEVGQSKAYRVFKPTDLAKATAKFLEHWETRWRPMQVRKLIIFVGCVVKSGKTDDLLIAETARFAALGIELELWDAWRIHRKLNDAPQVVSTYLGRDYHAKLFGDASAPFADLQRELLRGDMTGRRAMALVARLNQAETAELQELKRRVHRGEADAVFEQLEDTLHQPGVRDAIAPEVRAGMERLLAALVIARGDYPYAKLLLDRADGHDGGQAPRLRAMLVLESEGNQALLDFSEGTEDDGVREVRAVAHLRAADPERALEELAPALAVDEPSAEALRLAALAHLVRNDREAAIVLARRSVARDPNVHAGQQALAVALFNAALAPSVEPELGDWPQPVDLAFVQSGDEAQARLAEAELIFARLASAPASRDRDMATAWHVATLTLRRGHRAAAQAAVDAMQARDALSPAVIAWGMSHALSFDAALAATMLDRRIADHPRDLQAILVRVALANFSADHAAARDLLATHRDALAAAGHGEIFDYWTAVTDLEARRKPDATVLRKHPWLDLRSAMAVRSKKRRLTAIGEIVERQAGPGGDRRVLLAGLQLLLEGGWYKLVAKLANVVLDEVGTAEAVATAAQVLHLAGDQAGALAALDHRNAFAGGELPASLVRLRVVCLAKAGRIPAAAQESAILAAQTLSPQDLWSSINYHISLGAVPAALALWRDNADALAEPSPGHIMLARAAMHVDPDMARRVTAQIAARVPDHLVTAAFDLSAKLRMREQSDLLGRIIRLGSDDSAGVVRMDSVEDALTFVRERREAIDRARITYNQGHAPIHLLSVWRPGAIAAAYLGSQAMARARRAAGDIFGTRYARRYAADLWPSDRGDARLVADVTALLSAHNLDLLDKVERTFKPIHTGPDTLNALSAMRADLAEMQPDRLEAMRAVSAYLADGALNEDAHDQLDPYTVLWSAEGGEPSSTLNFTRLVGLLRPLAPTDRVEAIAEALARAIEEDARGATPPPDAIINIEVGMAVLLEQAGLLSHAVRHLRLHVPREQAGLLDGEIAEAVERGEQLVRLDALYDRIAAGVADGAYAFVPPVKERHHDPLQASMMQALADVGDRGGLFWVDDRFLSSIDNAQLRVVTTAEVIDALLGYGRLDAGQRLALRQRLRALDVLQNGSLNDAVSTRAWA